MKIRLVKPSLFAAPLAALFFALGISSSTQAHDNAGTYGCVSNNSCSSHSEGDVGFIENALNCIFNVCCSGCHNASMDTRKSNLDQLKSGRVNFAAFKREHSQAIKATRAKVQREKPKDRDIRQLMAPKPLQKVDRDYQDLYKALSR